MKTCACSCGGFVTPGKTYLKGHNRRKTTKYCIDPVTGCWEWLLFRDENGYGRDHDETGRTVQAYRHIYIKLRGPIPGDVDLDHTCRNTGCVNPDHLEPVTHKENMRRGSSTRLTLPQVESIRSRILNGETQVSLSIEFGVSDSQISRIFNHKSWE